MSKEGFMDVKKEVPNYTICKKLKEIGIPQTGSGLYWKGDTIIYIDTNTCSDYIKAPTYEELRIYLPNYIDRVGYKYIYEDAKSNVYIEYEGVDDKGQEIAIKAKGRTYAEAAGKMLCKLDRYGLKFSNENNRRTEGA